MVWCVTGQMADFSNSRRRRVRSLCVAAAGLVLAAPVAALADGKAAEKPVPIETLFALAGSGLEQDAPVYIRIFKEESELEVWKRRADGRYVNVKTFPICTWSGGLGPKTAQGDLMSPEGFYWLGHDSLKPDSKYHLALNVGYPNALDRALGRTGAFIMVHGDCKSVGCFAMTDAMIEEIYAFVRDALASDVEGRVPIHIFPFRMTGKAMARHAEHPAKATWAPLKEAYDDFAETRQPPRVGMCSKRYVVNPLADVGSDPNVSCPSQVGKLLAPVSTRKARVLAKAITTLRAKGVKQRTAADIAVSHPIATAAPAASRQKVATGRDSALGSIAAPMLTPN